MIPNQFTILVVEDIDSIRLAIIEELSVMYNVFGAENYDFALELLHSKKVDLVITDINMPGRSGIELIEYIKLNFPNTIYTLMTAYNINDFIHYALTLNIWNIIPKYSFLDLKFISIMANKLLTKNIFGISRYFDGKFQEDRNNLIEPFHMPQSGITFRKINSDKTRKTLCNQIGKTFKRLGAPNSIQQVLEELTANAMVRAPRDSVGQSKYQFELPSKDLLIPLEEIILAEEDSFEIGFGVFDETCIFSVVDHFGSLRKEEILKRLDRHIIPSSFIGLPQGISDSHGRGLYICRELADQLIINIQKNIKTEVIVFIKLKNNSMGYKSLSIFEI